MTDKERDEVFNRKHDEVCKEIFGDTPDDYVYADTEVKFIDKHWNSGKSWHDRPRIHDVMNVNTAGIRKFQEQISNNNGVINTFIEDKPLSEDDNQIG